MKTDISPASVPGCSASASRRAATLFLNRQNATAGGAVILALGWLSLLLVPLIAAAQPEPDAADPYPAYLSRLSVEMDVSGNSPATENYAYWGTQVDAAGWTDYYIVNLADTAHLDRKLMIHVPSPGAKIAVAFVGDSTIDKIGLTAVMPDVATLNAGTGGERCVDTLERMPEIAALEPGAIVVGCGNSDVFSAGKAKTTPEMAESQAALAGVMAGRWGAPVIVGTLTPILPALPMESATIVPSVVAQRIRDYNAWLRTEATAQGLLIWNRWGNLAAAGGNWGIPFCYEADGIHAANCGQMQVAGLRYLIAVSH